MEDKLDCAYEFVKEAIIAEAEREAGILITKKNSTAFCRPAC